MKRMMIFIMIIIAIIFFIIGMRFQDKMMEEKISAMQTESEMQVTDIKEDYEKKLEEKTNEQGENQLETEKLKQQSEQYLKDFVKAQKIATDHILKSVFSQYDTSKVLTTRTIDGKEYALCENYDSILDQYFTSNFKNNSSYAKKVKRVGNDVYIQMEEDQSFGGNIKEIKITEQEDQVISAEIALQNSENTTSYTLKMKLQKNGENWLIDEYEYEK